MTTEENHAIGNARAWLSTVAELAAKLTAAGDTAAAEEVREEIQQGPLSIQVRDGWHSVGETDNHPAEFELLLTTGGPALRIRGDLDDWAQPEQPIRLQWQDWGTPWTDHELTDEDRAALLVYCGVFYYGDG